jgi:hypothetical protein
MSVQTVCDICEQPKNTPFKVTENDGTAYDICSAPCFVTHTKRMEEASK